MVSDWQKMLGISRLEKGRWYIGLYTNNIYCLGDVVRPPDDLSEEEAEEWECDWSNPVLPEEINGNQVLGIVDGEFVATDELISRDSGVEFGKQSLDAALEYLRSERWTTEEEFDDAWKRITAVANGPVNRTGEEQETRKVR